MFSDAACVYDRVTDALFDLLIQILTSTSLVRLISKSGDLFIIDTNTSRSWVALVRFNYLWFVRHLTDESSNTISVGQSQFGFFF